MAYLNKKGEIELTSEDRESLKDALGKNWSDNIINWILWDKEIPVTEN